MGAGSGAALDASDAALLHENLRRIPWVLALSREAVRTIHTNVAIALGLKGLFVVLTLAGWSTLWLAVLADTGASVLVVANSLRLLRRRPQPSDVR